MFPGAWTVFVIPENKQALAFWRSVIAKYTAGNYQEKQITVNMKFVNYYSCVSYFTMVFY